MRTSSTSFNISVNTGNKSLSVSSMPSISASRCSEKAIVRRTFHCAKHTFSLTHRHRRNTHSSTTIRWLHCRTSPHDTQVNKFIAYIHRTCLKIKHIKGKKVKEVDLYSAFIVVPHTQGAQVRIAQCYLQITPHLPLPHKCSPDGASPDWGCRHRIAAYYSICIRPCPKTSNLNWKWSGIQIHMD